MGDKGAVLGAQGGPRATSDACESKLKVSTTASSLTAGPYLSCTWRQNPTQDFQHHLSVRRRRIPFIPTIVQQ